MSIFNGRLAWSADNGGVPAEGRQSIAQDSPLSPPGVLVNRSLAASPGGGGLWADGYGSAMVHNITIFSGKAARVDRRVDPSLCPLPGQHPLAQGSPYSKGCFKEEASST